MKDTRIADFVGYNESPIVRRSGLFYFSRLFGFCIGVVVPAGILLWAVASNQIKYGVISMFVFAPAGFLGFLLSYHAASYCKLCGLRLEKFWNAEQRGNTRYSGHIFVCQNCRAFESRLDAEFES